MKYQDADGDLVFQIGAHNQHLRPARTQGIHFVGCEGGYAPSHLTKYAKLTRGSVTSVLFELRL
jgi:hypothetical protein